MIFNSLNKPWRLHLISLQNHNTWIYTHSIDTTLLTIMIGRKLGYNEEGIYNLAIGALFHDIGVLLIPKKILMKSSKITDEEYAIIKKHSELGYSLIQDLDIPDISKRMALQHHERLDGSGYPYGLTEKDIVPEVKILMVADIFDSMTSCRDYRPAKNLNEILDYFSKNLDIYSPDVVEELYNLGFGNR